MKSEKKKAWAHCRRGTPVFIVRKFPFFFQVHRNLCFSPSNPLRYICIILEAFRLEIILSAAELYN